MAKEYVSNRPDVMIASVTIFHPQLRDLLQPGEKKGKVMFVHGSAIESVDFEQMKGPEQFCSLDFDAVCLTTGAGLVAAGGEHSELDIRPLPNQMKEEVNNRPRWHLRTPTGGSINNSICIQPEPIQRPNAMRGVVLIVKDCQEKEGKEIQEIDTIGHKEKRRKDEAIEKVEKLAWKRDEPWGRPGEIELPEKNVEIINNNDIKELRQILPLKPIRLMISNNDRSVKSFRLRPPSQRQSGQAERIESGLPGLSRTQTVAFPTCINHSSFSPDGKHVVSVGDTPEVFLFSVHPITGELNKIATYLASSDASFSTTWSPDSMQFAVASQDGIISIWDVRSSKKIASLQTSQFSDRSGAGAARVVKWGPRGDVLAFTEQQNYVHIVDTINFETIQKIRIPSLGMINGRALNNSTSNPDDILLAAGAGRSGGFENDEIGINVGEDWLESTSPARFASSSRVDTTNSFARPWPNGRRYRDIGNPSTRSTLDRALMGEWSNNSRSRPTSTSTRLSLNRAENVEGGEQSRSSFQVVNTSNTSSPPNNEITWQHDVQNSVISAVRSVDSILNSGPGVWSMGSNVNHRVRRRGDSIVDISGLTWDPDGDYLYISTIDLITRYSVIDSRGSFSQGSVR